KSASSAKNSAHATLSPSFHGQILFVINYLVSSPLGAVALAQCVRVTRNNTGLDGPFLAELCKASSQSGSVGDRAERSRSFTESASETGVRWSGRWSSRSAWNCPRLVCKNKGPQLVNSTTKISADFVFKAHPASVRKQY